MACAVPDGAHQRGDLESRPYRRRGVPGGPDRTPHGRRRSVHGAWVCCGIAAGLPVGGRHAGQGLAGPATVTRRLRRVGRRGASGQSQRARNAERDRQPGAEGRPSIGSTAWSRPARTTISVGDRVTTTGGSATPLLPIPTSAPLSSHLSSPCASIEGRSVPREGHGPTLELRCSDGTGRRFPACMRRGMLRRALSGRAPSRLDLPSVSP